MSVFPMTMTAITRPQATQGFTVRRCLRWLGLPLQTRHEQAMSLVKERLVIARRNNDEETAKLLSSVKAFLHRNLVRTCQGAGCTVAIGRGSLTCKKCRILVFLFLSLGFACAVTCHGGRARVEWDASSTTNVTYVLYAHTNALSGTNLYNAAVRVNVGTNLTATALFTNAGRWHLVATALDHWGVESDPSNELIVQIPAPVANLRTVAIDHAITLTGPYTNVGFFRLSIGP